jgi:hypothetical protein
MQELLTLLVAVLVPAIAVYLTTQALKLNGTIDSLPGLVKQVITVLEAFVFGKLSALLGVQLPATLAGLDPTVVGTVLTTLASWLIHRLFAPKPAA